MIMMIHLPAIIKELQRHYHVQLYGNCNICISGVRLCKNQAEPEKYTPGYLNIVRLRSLSQLAGVPASAPVLCVVHPDNLAVTSSSYFGNNTMVIVFALDLDEVLLTLSAALYTCGQANSNLEELSKALLKCKSVDEALTIGYQWLHTPLLLADHQQNILYQTGNPSVSASSSESIWSVFQPSQENKQISAMLKAMDDSAQAQWPVMVIDNINDPSILCKTLCSDTRIDGYLLLHYQERPYMESDSEILELLGNVCAILLRNEASQRAQRETESDVLGYMLDHQIDDAAFTRDQMERYMDQTHYEPKEVRYVLSIYPSDEIPDHFRPIHGLLEYLTNSVPGCIGTYFMNNLTLLIESDEALRDFSEAWPNLEQALREHRFIAGISNACHDIMELKDYYYQAQRAATLGRVFFPETTLIPYYKCAPYHLMEIGTNFQPPRDFCDPNLLKLQQMDMENHTDLIHTLWTYLETGRNKAQTAKRLFLHINTVTYRLNQIGQIINIQNTSIDDEFRLYLSLLLLRYDTNIERVKRTGRERGELDKASRQAKQGLGLL